MNTSERILTLRSAAQASDIPAAGESLWTEPPQPSDNLLAALDVADRMQTRLLYCERAELPDHQRRDLATISDLVMAALRGTAEAEAEIAQLRQRLGVADRRIIELEAEIDQRDEALDSLLPYAPDEQAEAA